MQTAATHWPAELGAPSRFRELRPKTTIFAETDHGMPRARRKYTKNAVPFEVGFLWSRADITRFEEWLADELADGAFAFRGTHWRQDVEGTKMIVDRPTYNWIGGDTFEVTFTETFWSD